MNKEEMRKLLDDVKTKALDIRKAVQSAEGRESAELTFVLITIVDELFGQVQSLGGFNSVGTGMKSETRPPQEIKLPEGQPNKPTTWDDAKKPGAVVS